MIGAKYRVKQEGEKLLDTKVAARALVGLDEAQIAAVLTEREDAIRASARYQLPDDILEEARIVLVRCLRGQVEPRTAETQRRAAEALLKGHILEQITDEALEAEVNRRLRLRKRAAGATATAAEPPAEGE